MDRSPGLSVRLKLTISYAGFLMIAGGLLLATVWVFLLRYVPDHATFGRGPFSPTRSDLMDAFAPRAAQALVFLLLFGLVGGWLLAGRMLAPLTRITDATRIAANGTLLDGSADDAGVLIARDGFAPAIAWTGSRYVLAWYEALPTYGAGGRERVHAIRTAILENLGGTSSNERKLAESVARDPISIAVANGFTILAYSRLGDDEVYGGVPRAFLDVPVAPSAPRRRAVRK